MHFTDEATGRLGKGEVHHANASQKKADVAPLISQKINFGAKNVARGKEVNFIKTNASIPQEDVANPNTPAPTANLHNM